MKEFYDGRLTIRNERGKLSVLLLGNDGLPTAVMKLDRNKDQILGFIKMMKKIENTPPKTIKFIRGALYDCYRYDKLKFDKHNVKEPIIDAELIDMTEMTEQYRKMLEEEGEE